MGTWNRKIDFGFRGWSLLAGASAVIVLAWAVLLGSRARTQPQRCASDFSEMGSRCCAEGQGMSAGQCVGSPDYCPKPFQKVTSPVPGCVIENRKVRIQGGSVTLGPTDWDSLSVVERHTVSVTSFWIDSSEVTHHRHHECVHAGMCKAQPTENEPGLPLVGLSHQEAEDFCAFAGGHLPSSAQWVFAASGEAGRRYPWGPHGLVCRRATFGLTDGPCATEGTIPDLAGSRPDGATPEGLLDIAGNVAEWAMQDESPVVLGGSFRSKRASELKVWASRPGTPGDDVGFRCAYPDRSSPPPVDVELSP